MGYSGATTIWVLLGVVVSRAAEAIGRLRLPKMADEVEVMKVEPSLKGERGILVGETVSGEVEQATINITKAKNKNHFLFNKILFPVKLDPIPFKVYDKVYQHYTIIILVFQQV